METTEKTIDPLLVDLYAEDCNGHPAWLSLVAAGAPWHGAILKATEGLTYKPGWFADNWSGIKQCAGSRLGVDFFVGTYHYLRFGADPVAQAETYLGFVGKFDGALPPVVDVERAGNTIGSAAQVVDCTSQFTAKIKAELGVLPILYGGELLRSLGITDHMGCGKLWMARYSAALPPAAYQSIGWELADLFAWQYCGDGESSLDHYPAVSPLGKTDISAAIVNGGGEAALAWMAANRVGK